MNKLMKGLLLCGAVILTSSPVIANANEYLDIEKNDVSITTPIGKVIEKRVNLEKESKSFIGNRIYVDKPSYIVFNNIQDIENNLISDKTLKLGNYYNIVDTKLINNRIFFEVSMGAKEHSLGWVAQTDFKYANKDLIKSVSKYNSNDSFYTTNKVTKTYERIPENVVSKKQSDTFIDNKIQVNILEEFEKTNSLDYENWYYLDLEKEFTDEKTANEFVKNSEFTVEKKEVTEQDKEGKDNIITTYHVRVSGWVNQTSVSDLSIPLSYDLENLEGKAVIKEKSTKIYDNSLEKEIFTLNDYQNQELKLTSIKTKELKDTKEKWFTVQKIDSLGNPTKDKVVFVNENNFDKTNYSKVKKETDVDSLVSLRNETIVYDKPIGIKGYKELSKLPKDGYYYVKKQIITEHDGKEEQWFEIADVDDNMLGTVKGDTIKYIKGDKIKHTVKQGETLEDVLKTYKITKDEFELMNLDLVYLKDVEFKEGLEVVVKAPTIEYNTDNVQSGVTESGMQLVKDMMPTAPYITESGIKPSVAYAQAILESGGGTSGLATRDNNLFGIKGTYKGQGSSWATLEDSGGGNMYGIDSTFRAYPNKMVSVFDYVDLITNSGIYDRAIGLETPEETITAIWDSGYATDSFYVDKIMKIINMYDLTQFDKY